MHYDHIAWDFNGTILDDAPIDMAATNVLLARRHLPLIPDRATYDRLFRFPIEEYYRDIGFDFTRESYADMAVEWNAVYREMQADAPTQKGVSELIRRIAAAGIPQSVLSASEEGILREQLASRGLLSYFEGVWGRGDGLAAGKTDLVLAFRDRRRPGRVLFIGDTDHDAACAAAAGFDCVLLTTGHQSAARLAPLGVPLFSDGDALADYLTREGFLCPN